MAATAADVEGSERPDARPGPAARAWRAVTGHPVATTAVAGVVVGAINVAWVAANRAQGGFDGDETSYLASALRFRRLLDTSGIGAVAEAALHNYRNGPLVPLLSAAAARPGDVITSAMAVQPVLALVAAVAIASTARRVADDRAALVAGLVTLGLPAMVVSARSYQLVVGATAALAVAVWALLRSERGARTGYLVAFGAAVGAMLIARTMTISYLPGLGLAALLVVERTRRGVVGLAASGAAALVVAGPWWIAEWSTSIYPYLFRYGYGEGAGPLGPASPPLRVLVRLGLVMGDVRVLLVVPAVVAVAAGALALRRALVAEGWRPVLDRHREVAALWVVVVVGWLALLSSSNIGTYFQLPLEVVAVAGIVALPIGPRLRRTLGPIAVAAAVANVALLSHWGIGSSVRVGGSTLSLVAFGGVEVAQAIDFENGDPRFAPTASDAERRAAMADWAAAQNHTAFAVEELTPEGGEVMQTFLGDIRLFQATTLSFAEELTGTGRSPWEAPTATSTIGDGEVSLATRDPEGRPRILVAVRATTYTDQEGEPADEVLAEAADRGWYVAREVPLPDGGSVELWIHPDNAADHGMGS